MPAIIGTAILVAVAVIAWLHWFSTWVILDVEKRVPAPLPAPEPAHAVSPTVINIDLRGLTELISVMNNHHHLPVVVIGFVAVTVVFAAAFAWTFVRITESHNRRHYAPPRYNAIPEIEHRPREINKGNLPVVGDDNPFRNWK